jgi:hypothetical protein
MDDGVKGFAPSFDLWGYICNLKDLSTGGRFDWVSWSKSGSVPNCELGGFPTSRLKILHEISIKHIKLNGFQFASLDSV